MEYVEELLSNLSIMHDLRDTTGSVCNGNMQKVKEREHQRDIQEISQVCLIADRHNTRKSLYRREEMKDE